MPQTFTQINPHLWVAQSRSLHLNSGIFIGGGQGCLVDPGLLPDEIERIARFVREQGAALQTIILTHSDWDHILGPERLPGARVLAHADYLDALRRDDGGVGRMVARWEAHHGVVRERPFAMPRPDVTFERSTTQGVGELILRLAHAPGHAADQLVIYHDDSGTLWAGDMLSDLEIPFIIDSLAAYQRSLAYLAGLDIRALVPGHGRPTTDQAQIRARLSEDQAYLAEVRTRVEQALREGQPLEVVVAGCAGMRYRNREENEQPHRLNVETAYVELGGAVDADTVGYRRAWKEATGME
jgi:glyoxylase-like metal-dependent hydrolase (beta-lactamase superfamily II)